VRLRGNQCEMPKKTETFKVEKLVDMRLEKGKKLFLVKWKGYPASQNTWEPVGHLDDCKEEMKAFEKKTTKSPIAKKAAPAKKSPTPAKKEAKRPKTANTRAMTTKPKRAPKAAEVKEAAPAKKAAPPKAKPATFDIKQISALLMATIAGKKLPKPEKPAKPEKAGKRKREDGGVVEVDHITGVRYRAKGGVQYQIKWKDGSSSWEPEDNVMDDDLIDEFEEAEQVKVYGDSAIAVGDEVEVKAVDEGFANSWSAAVIKKKEKGSKFTVEYTAFVDDDGNGMTEGGLERKRLRIAPDAAPKGWTPSLGEIVEVNEDDCWWEARVKSLPGKGKAELIFRVSDEVKTMALTKKVRPCSWLNMAK